MEKVAYIYGPELLTPALEGAYDTPDRILAAKGALDMEGLSSRMVCMPVRAAGMLDLTSAHDMTYAYGFRDWIRRGGGLKGAYPVREQEFELALLSAGGCVDACGEILNGSIKSTLALTRPPGHLAAYDYPAGPSLFNNAAICAQTFLKGGLDKAAIVSFTARHSSGTQDIFYRKRKVLTISAHQVPNYPQGGFSYEVGAGPAIGTNINIPLPVGSGDIEYMRVFKEIVEPALRRHEPEVILVSLGFDISTKDRITGQRVSAWGFSAMAALLVKLADELCSGRVMFFMEDGANLEAIAEGTIAVGRALLGDFGQDEALGLEPEHIFGAPDIECLLKEIKNLHNL
ncbi:MAG: histone deacetylase [Chloroflexi bacterium]|nr:histone deacetylase [Chloroflexota bacterium]